MRKKSQWLWTCILCISIAGCNTELETPNQEAEAEAETEVLETYFAAFNEHDIEKLLALSSDDIRLMSVYKDSVAVDISGRQELRTYLEGYFSNIPNVNSSFSGLTSEPPFISFVETVSWGDEGADRKSQSALATYRIQDGKVQRAWYFY